MQSKDFDSVLWHIKENKVTEFTLRPEEAVYINLEQLRVICEALKVNTSVKSLNLSYIPLGDEVALLLNKVLKKNTNITKLCLNNNLIGDEGIHLIGLALKVNKSLKRLTLNNNFIGDTGINVFIREILKNKSLVQLDLSENWITDKGAKSIIQILKKTPTEKDIRSATIRLKGNQISQINLETINNFLEKNKKFVNFYAQAVRTLWLIRKAAKKDIEKVEEISEANRLRALSKIPKPIMKMVFGFFLQDNREIKVKPKRSAQVDEPQLLKRCKPAN